MSSGKMRINFSFWREDEFALPTESTCYIWYSILSGGEAVMGRYECIAAMLSSRPSPGGCKPNNI
jgi:hypothetical protein